MKRLIGILLFVLTAHLAWSGGPYAGESVLKSGKFVKIRVEETGVYKLTYADLKSMGLNPASVRVYGFGGAMLSQYFGDKHIDDLPQVPVYMHKGSDGVFSDGDYILFYGQGPTTWQYTGYRFKHTTNYYSNYGYYFLTDSGAGQLFLEKQEATLDTVGCHHAYVYQNYQLHEVDSVNLIDIKEGEAGGGREWYGEVFGTNQQRSFNFRFPDLVAGGNAYCFIDVASCAMTSSNFAVAIGSETYDLTVSARDNDNVVIAAAGSGGFALTTNGSETQTAKLKYTTQSVGASSYLNYLTLTAECYLKLTDNVLFVRNVTNYMSEKSTVMHVSGASAETQVWDVTNLDNIHAVKTSLNGNELIFLSDNSSLQQFVVINPTKYNGLQIKQFSKNVYHKSVSNQNLHALHDIDMVIITPQEFVEPSQRLAAEHERVDALTTAVVIDEEIFNEFSSGTPDATAYRMLMKMLDDRALASGGKEHRPRFLLLMGDGSFDNRKLSSSSPMPILLTYQAANSVNEARAYATDDYFGFLGDNMTVLESRDSMMISIGRLPVRELEQANQVVDKIIRYMDNTSFGKWKTQLCFLADDGNSGMHTTASDQAAEIVKRQTKDLIVNKIYIDAYQQETRASGDSYPIAKSKLDNLFSSGLLFFDYSGHAGYNNICDEQMLTAKEVREMSNQNMGLWMLATCNFARFDALHTSAAELAVLNPNGGAVSLIAACRTVYAENNRILNNYFCEKLFEQDGKGHFVNTVGEALRAAKWLTTVKNNGDMNKLSYLLLGDPALRLNYPEQYTITTSSAQDTLRALSVQRITGFIQTHDGDIASDFNGKLYVSVFDKQQEISTLDNDQPDPEKKRIVKFVDYPNMLFSGETEVVNGLFSFTFMIPKDIRYNYGNGRITYYACDTVVGGEAMGHYEDVTIGGSYDIQMVDTVGPTVNMYLNNKSFRSGDQTNERPHLYAEISDVNGINTVGSGLGHDLLLVVDNDKKQTYILNDNFIAKSGSYQDGSISYKMSEMAEGQHTLMLRAWDLLNNSSTATLDFEVVKGLTPEISSLLVYPNPVTQDGLLRVAVNHDRPDVTLITDLYIYDIAGYTAYHHQQFGADDIIISPAECHLRPGAYFLRVMIKTEDSKYASKTAKIIVLK